jgi:hypothetical protein
MNWEIKEMKINKHGFRTIVFSKSENNGELRGWI